MLLILTVPKCYLLVKIHTRDSVLTNSKASSTAGSREKGACYYLKHFLVSLLNYGMANYILVMPMKRKRHMS